MTTENDCKRCFLSFISCIHIANKVNQTARVLLYCFNNIEDNCSTWGCRLQKGQNRPRVALESPIAAGATCVGMGSSVNWAHQLTTALEQYCKMKNGNNASLWLFWLVSVSNSDRGNIFWFCQLEKFNWDDVEVHTSIGSSSEWIFCIVLDDAKIKAPFSMVPVPKIILLMETVLQSKINGGNMGGSQTCKENYR
ncbi:hypothetical protein Dimus_014185 [Dionaea muscipula]